MPVINFRQRFADAILSGRKRQTIRAPRGDHRPHAIIGGPLALYIGMRTKSCRKLMDAVCTNRRQIVITSDPYRVIVNGKPIEDVDDFAVADGFEGSADFYEFFAKVHGLPFEGWLIEWEPETSQK